MQYLTLTFNPLDITVDLAPQYDPIDRAAGGTEPVLFEGLLLQIEDAVITAVGELLTDKLGVDVTVRVRQPQIPRTLLVDEFHTEPF